MNKRRLIGLGLIALPVTVWGLAQYFNYDWIWNHTPASHGAGFTAAALSVLIMSNGLRMLSRSKWIALMFSGLIVCVVSVGQLFSIFMQGEILATTSLGNDREAVVQRGGTIGTYWTFLVITEPKWLILRETRRLRSYDAPVQRMYLEPDGALFVEIQNGPIPRSDRIPASELTLSPPQVQ